MPVTVTVTVDEPEHGGTVEVRLQSGRDNLPRFLLSALGKRILGAVQDVVSTAREHRAAQRDEGNGESHDEAHEGETT